MATATHHTTHPVPTHPVPHRRFLDVSVPAAGTRHKCRCERCGCTFQGEINAYPGNRRVVNCPGCGRGYFFVNEVDVAEGVNTPDEQDQFIADRPLTFLDGMPAAEQRVSVECWM